MISTKNTKDAKRNGCHPPSFAAFVSRVDHSTSRLYECRRQIAVALMLVMAAVVSTRAAGPAWTVEEKSLGAVVGYDSIRGIAMTSDENHLVFLGISGKKQVIVLDGKPGPAFEWIIPESVSNGPDGAHIAYLIQSSTETQPVIDGQPGKGYYTVDRNQIFWSPDGKRTAMGVQLQGGGAAIVVDGVPGAKFDFIDAPLFSPDSKRIAYVARRAKQQFVVVDGQEQKAYEAVGRLTFSPNSKHLSYEAIANGKCLLVLDGQEGKIYDSVKLGPGFSVDGARLVAVVAQANKLIVLVNGRESEPYEKMVAGDFVLSPDGKRIAYAVKKGEKQLAVIDGVENPPFDHISANAMSFSPDSRRIAYVAGTVTNGPDFVVLDGVPQKPYEGILVGTPLFSPDSKRVAFGAKRDGKWRFVVDGVEGKPYDFIEPPSIQIFSPNSQRVAYRAANGKSPTMVIDGVESVTADYVGPVSFSPDSKHVAFLRIREGKTYLVIDGAEVAGPYTSAVPETRVIFDDNITAHFIATRKDEFFRVKVKL
ncbi:MAG TPA: hypothetical protein VG326_12080 [Tepidisphaeraceae bacterium]|nr:hypothetical protein [Tepidisphaeraceae bacterium]